MKMPIKTMLTAMAASVGLLAAASAVQADERLLIGSTSSSSSHYGYFVAVNQIINSRVDGVSASVAETGATVDNLRRLGRNQIDMGLVTTNTGYHAYAGLEDFDGRPVDSRLLWVYTVAPQNVVMRRDADVATLEALEGVRFNPGITGSATEKTTEAVLRTLGISPDYVRGSTTDIVDAMKDGRVMGSAKSGVGNKLDGSSMDIATFTPISVLSLSGEQAETLRAEMPDVAIVDIPEGAGDGIPAYTTWAFGVAVHAHPDLDEEIAYQIVKAVMENPEPQANAFSAIRDADLAEMTLQVGTVPLHPGAARYFEEQGLEIPDALKPAQ
ncbi:TAXI family TRAP transporter solute-binding subunit [Halomonas heilongjiangensis]|uniref:TAXI family TRAP transporter solute-binding subunit n=1 Tax=Halomonas heilongjiangensis TaxID=1387883 RepID=UPI001F0C7595|nr:TAXI family TRAP transporter solute-binding subunit [Halomonas heilongjiangensis]